MADTLTNLVLSEIFCRIVSAAERCENGNDTDACACLDLLQVLSILTMERPVSFSAEDIRDEKVCCATDVITR